MIITDNNTLKLWKKALKIILTEGEEYTDVDGKIWKDIPNVVLKITNVSRKNIEGPINYLNSFDSFLYPSKEELMDVIFKRMQAPIYEYTYGDRIFMYNGVKNQIEDFIIPLLKKNKSTRKGVISIYDAAKDSNIENHNTPSLMYIHVRIFNDKLLLSASIRSNEMLFGIAANIFQLYILQKYIADELNVDLGDITIIGNSTHICINKENEILEAIRKEFE